MSASYSPAPFLPATMDEVRARGWTALDVVLITGDAHVDHPAFPAALLGRLLEDAGFRVGVIPQPDARDPRSVAVLGLPRLFFGVTAGTLDSMVANTTALRRRRSDDAYTPGGRAGGRPDRAVTVYCNLVRQAFGKAAFVVAGGIEASLRAWAHYDYWSDSVRRPLLMDCGADLLVRGMGEGPIVEVARRLRRLLVDAPEVARAAEERRPCRSDLRVAALRSVPGIVYRQPRREPLPDDAVVLPGAEAVAAAADAHCEAYRTAATTTTRPLAQACAGMVVVAQPRWPPLASETLDRVYQLPFRRAVHPIHGGATLPALEAVRFSVTSHRGCFGGCSFCAISAHQGKSVSSRSAESVLAEIATMREHPGFAGEIRDVGGPTANMYGLGCTREVPCQRPSCLWPARCPDLATDGQAYLELLRRASAAPGVRRLFVTTGLRHDLALLTPELLRQVAQRHTSGQLKVAPEHVSPEVLAHMRKPADDGFLRFVEAFRSHAPKGRRGFVLPYLMAAHPGSRLEHMVELALFLKRNDLVAEQCQIFTPTPGTASTVMYATGLDPFTGRAVFVERGDEAKRLQKALILYHRPEQADRVRRALRACGRQSVEGALLGRTRGRRR